MFIFMTHGNVLCVSTLQFARATQKKQKIPNTDDTASQQAIT